MTVIETVFQRTSMIARRAVAWPLVFIGYVLTEVAVPFIVVGAWLADHEDAYKNSRSK